MALAKTDPSVWDPKYPVTKNQNPSKITRAEILAMLQSGAEIGKDLLLIDLRREDLEGGTIKGSINLPAQTLYPSIPALYSMVSQANVKSVIWYCGSSQHRGLRAAAWFHDYIESRNEQSMQSLVLVEGIRGWATAGPNYTALMEGYSQEHWK